MSNSLEVLHAALDSISDYAVFTLNLEGEITTWNKGAENTKGYYASEIIGQNFSCFYREEDREAGLPLQALSVARERGKFHSRAWRIKKNGDRFWADVTIHPIRDDDGQVSGYVKVTRDITDLLELEKLREESFRLKKQELISQLTGGIAHDFNNLITVISSGHELINSYSLDDRVERIIEVIQVALSHSKKLISQLMSFSGQNIIKPEPTNLNEVIKIFDVLVEKSIGASSELHWDLAEELPIISLDHAQCQSALLNLIFNARDAMPYGGTIRIFTELVSVPTDHIDLFDDLSPGQYVVLGVRDSGRGIPSAFIKRAVEPFFTTKDVGRGPGLGLSQCYGFARQAGGTISIESTENTGTCVRLLFPISNEILKTDKAAKSRTILLVDDEFAIRDLVGEMLRTLGHTVYLAEDAQDALSQLEKNITIDYLFTDIIMPSGMSGVELAEKAQAMRPGLPTLLASGYSRDVLRNLADLREDISFLRKPYSISELSDHINRKKANGTAT